MTVQECITPEIKQKAEEKSREFLG
jgi:hypothetical protein